MKETTKQLTDTKVGKGWSANTGWLGCWFENRTKGRFG